MPLVSVTLNVERQDESFDFANIKAELSVNPDSLTNFDLNCNVAELGSTLRVDFQYNCQLFKAESVRGWLEQFRRLLESVRTTPQQSMAEILAFTEAPRPIERDRTPAASDDHRAILASFEPPSTPAQQTVARIWQDLLGVKKIGVQDNFFELGGHSLLMIQVLGRIRGKLQTKVSLRRFFEAPTVAGLAAAIEERLADEINDLSETEARDLLRLTK